MIYGNEFAILFEFFTNVLARSVVSFFSTLFFSELFSIMFYSTPGLLLVYSWENADVQTRALLTSNDVWISELINTWLHHLDLSILVINMGLTRTRLL